MSGKRASRACERCRRIRRRCEPPHPCHACLAAGVRCEVRIKSRPNRTSVRSKNLSDVAHDTATKTTLSHEATPVQTAATGHSAPRLINRPGNTFGQVRELVKRLLREECGYDLQCQLSEPPLPGLNTIPISSEVASSPTSCALGYELIKGLLVAFERFNGGELIEPRELLTWAQVIHPLVHMQVEVDHLTSLVMAQDLPIDSTSLLFSALALGALLSGEVKYARFCFGVSTKLGEQFVGCPSLHLCLAYFLQHAYIIRAGTSTHARAMIAQTVQACHDLRLHHTSRGVQGLHLYLLVYMADQYSSLTHDTAPAIHTSTLPPRAFDSLAAARPHLKPLIDLVSVNGHVIEHCHPSASFSTQEMATSEVVKLEAMMGALRTERQAALSNDWSYKSFMDICEPIARVHMLCCRIQLRAPGLSSPDDWVASISISMHAAAGVLAAYFQLYSPALRALASRSFNNAPSAAGVHVLPPTWRQVKRIMLCVLLLILAYWRGEIAHDEASRHLAIARLSLEYPRAKWGDKLNEALQVITDVSHIANFRLQEHMGILLPTENPNFPFPMEHERECENGCELMVDAQPHRGPSAAANPSCSIESMSHHDSSTTPVPDQGSMLGQASPYTGFDFDYDINSLSFWQLTEQALEDALLL